MWHPVYDFHIGGGAAWGLKKAEKGTDRGYMNLKVKSVTKCSQVGDGVQISKLFADII